ncbi:hypothetical protein WJX79_008616 [Trebouxia sp. C0005]
MLNSKLCIRLFRVKLEEQFEAPFELTQRSAVEAPHPTTPPPHLEACQCPQLYASLAWAPYRTPYSHAEALILDNQAA